MMKKVKIDAKKREKCVNRADFASMHSAYIVLVYDFWILYK